MAQSSVNLVMLMGNLGRDPELKYTASGVPVVNLRLATGRFRKDPNGGKSIEDTDWHDIVVFNQAAEYVAQYAVKGTKLHIEGSLQSRKWQDQDGKDHYSVEVLANKVIGISGTVNPEGAVDATGAAVRAPAPASAAHRPTRQPAGTSVLDTMDWTSEVNP